MPALMEVQRLTHVYSEGTPARHVALDDVSFSLAAGDFLGLAGHTGSGKSTLVQHLNGLLRPASGHILFEGEDIWAKPKEIRRFRFAVGLVFQYPESQLFEETVAKDIAFGPKNMGLSEAEINDRVREAAAAVGLALELLSRTPFALSGGERRRAAIAGVLAMRPRVLILDEPTAGLDPLGQADILAQLTEYHRRSGAAILLVSHSMETLASCCRRVLVLEHGHVFADGTVAEVFSRGEALSAIGLAPPTVTRIFSKLAAKGYPLDADVFTVAQAKAALLKTLEGRRARA